MRFFPPTEGRGRSWIVRMRGHGREEEELEDTVSHLSIYLTGLDELYCEQAAQLKHQIHRAEKATQELEEQRIEEEYKARRGIGGWIEEEEPEETHWDKGTQTEDEEHCLPPKKRRTWFEEASP